MLLGIVNFMMKTIWFYNKARSLKLEILRNKKVFIVFYWGQFVNRRIMDGRWEKTSKAYRSWAWERIFRYGGWRTRERVHKMVVAFAAKWMSTAGLSDIYVVPWHAMFMVFARTVAGCKEHHKTETLPENERSMATWAHKFNYVTRANVFFPVEWQTAKNCARR